MKRREQRMERVKRSAVKLGLRREARKTLDADYKRHIQEVIDDDDMFTAFVDGCFSESYAYADAFGDMTFFEWMKSVMEWFKENQELIRQFIELITDLFGGGFSTSEDD